MAHQKKLENIVHKLGNPGQFRKFVSYCVETVSKKPLSSSLQAAVEEAIVKNEQALLLEALERSLEFSAQKCYKSFHQNRKAYLWQKYKAILKMVGIALGILAVCIAIGLGLDHYQKLPFKKYTYHYVLADTLYMRDNSANNAIIDTLYYGDQVVINEIDAQKSTAMVEKDSESFWGATEGAVHSSYVIPEDQFELYTAILGNGNQDNINLKTPWIRKALINYFKSKNYLGNQSSKKVLKKNKEAQQWGFAGLQSPGNVHNFFRIDEQLNPKQRYVTRRYYALLNFGEERSLNADLSRKISRFTAMVLQSNSGNQRFLVFEFNAAQEVVETYAYDLPQRDDESKYVIKEIFRGFNEIPEMTPYVATYPGIICRSMNPDIPETILFYYDEDRRGFLSKTWNIPAKPF
ncbi:hypothetical protein [Spongiimicrobium salis]|uniref:hypothetical protein n=1 Tax=Spongiimicrobium salis TaxID=1667022 RepID=UPI00374D3767